MADEPTPPLPASPSREPWHRRLRQSLTRKVEVPRWAVFAVLLVLLLMPSGPIFNVWDNVLPDPARSLYISELDSRIDAPAAIREQCAASVESVGGSGDYVTSNGEEFLRWSVKPKPGHMDQVWLSTRTGKVICP